MIKISFITVNNKHFVTLSEGNFDDIAPCTHHINEINRDKSKGVDNKVHLNIISLGLVSCKQILNNDDVNQSNHYSKFSIFKACVDIYTRIMVQFFFL